MRIGIDATPITNRSGTGYYTQKLIEYLGRADCENEYFLFCPRGYERSLERLSMFDYPNLRIFQIAATGQVAQLGWKQLVLPRLLEKHNIDVVHYPSFIASLRTEAPSVLTVHDLCFSLFPETFSRVRRQYYQYIIPRSIGHCDSIIADSDSTKKDLVERVKTGNGNIETVHLGVDPLIFFHIKNENERRRIRRKYNLPEPFLLYVGTLEPRKNIARLIRAFAYGIVSKGLPHHLVVAGRKGWLYEEIFQEVRLFNLSGRVSFPGYVGQSDLAALYSLAHAFVYPSLYEGFGLPCLEAMSCGTPVIASDRASLPEIVGDSALMIDPLSVDSLADALRTICTDEALWRRLSEKGIQRACHFSWLTTAKKTLEVYTRTKQNS
jgi:glycosyltransferase involved in cell wall biosynthesis